jgi:hypothetical protein
MGASPPQPPVADAVDLVLRWMLMGPGLIQDRPRYLFRLGAFPNRINVIQKNAFAVE